MRDVMTPIQWRQLYIRRVKALRETKFTASEQMATALGIAPDTYRKYESRTPMPPDLVERFSLIVGVSIEFVLTGRYVKGKGPFPPNIPGPHTLDEEATKGTRDVAGVDAGSDVEHELLSGGDDGSVQHVPKPRRSSRASR